MRMNGVAAAARAPAGWVVRWHPRSGIEAALEHTIVAQTGVYPVRPGANR